MINSVSRTRQVSCLTKPAFPMFLVNGGGRPHVNHTFPVDAVVAMGASWAFEPTPSLVPKRSPWKHVPIANCKVNMIQELHRGVS